MSAKILNGLACKGLVILGLLFALSAIAYAQSFTDAAKAAEMFANASADNPFIAIIKLMAYTMIAMMILTAWTIRIIVSQAATNAQAITDFNSRPCVLAHKNPLLLGQLLDGAGSKERP